MWFTWMLRTSALQISERILQATLIEDLQIKFERNDSPCLIFENVGLKIDHDDNDEFCHNFELTTYRELIKVQTRIFFS